MGLKIYRLHYRGQMQESYPSDQLKGAVEECIQNIRLAQRKGKVLTAALYRWDKMLFFYYEALGEPLAVAEPAALAGEDVMSEGKDAALAWADVMSAGKDAALAGEDVMSAGKDAALVWKSTAADGCSLTPESGEDVQSTCIPPNELLAPLGSFLQMWPGQRKDRSWVHMYHIYYHSVPESIEQWQRKAVPRMRRGRIAFLRDDKLFSYTYFHKAIVEEGLLTGDKYQSIALHENILFSYFEEPKTFVNVRGDVTQESQVMKEWIAAGPEAHFIHMPMGNGENFMFLPALFALGVEDENAGD